MEKQQNEQIPVSLPRKQSSSELCDICLQQYHIVGRWPMLACPNGHFFCDQCIDNMFRYSNNEPCPCPICRAPIKKSGIKPHSALFTTINVESNVKEALGEDKRELFLYAFKHQIYEIAKTFKEATKISDIVSIDASNRNLIKIQHLEGFDKLKKLRMERNHIKTLVGLESLQGLKIINLSHNEICDISLLGKLKRLQVLAVQFNQIVTIPSLLLFSQLMHWFLWNPLKSTIIEEIFYANLRNLKTLSISFQQQKKAQTMIKFADKTVWLPHLNRLIFQDCLMLADKNKITKILAQREKMIKFNFVSPKGINLQQHQQWLQLWLEEYQIYGTVFAFHPDPMNPFIKDYKITSTKIIKQTSQFTILNSNQSIPKQSRQNFKIKLEEASQHMVMGLCNAYLRYNPNVYSEHFVGITLWGMVYSRGEASQLQSKLHLDAHPILRMCVDFEEETITWFCDEQQVARVVLPSQFRYSQLYFLLGMRDTDTAVSLLDE